ncbi:MAG: DMT family transporter [Propionibacteriaceae bacterium]|nr:DMT family transporter [Propionibacteriaceae bacterium]
MLRSDAARTGVVFLVLAGVAWGTSGTLGTLLSARADVGFLPIAGYRIFVGGLILFAVGLVTGLRFPRERSGWVRVVAMAACSAVYQFGFFSAVGLLGVSIATLITVGSAPVMVLAVDLLTGRQRLRLPLAAALVCTAVGLALFMGAPPAGVELRDALLGAGLSLLAGACFALISLMGARPVADYHDLTGTSLAFLLGGSAVFALSLAMGERVLFAPSLPSVAYVLALGLIPSAFAYLAYLRGLRSQTSTTGVMVALLEPITGSVLALLVLQERMSPAGVLGAVLLLSAVWLSTRRVSD